MTEQTEENLADASPEHNYEELEVDSYVAIRRLIWLYLVLWLIEGGLRRWFLPGLATPLLLIRDPLVVIIYLVAFSKQVFPINGFIISGAILAVLSFLSAMAIGHGKLVVALYGVRCDFLHVPLIFIMGRVLRQKDVILLCKVAVWLVIPYSALLVDQFYEPQTAWVNKGVGNSDEGAGFAGANGHFRPPGTFSFITGPASLYPLFTACWFTLLLARQLPAWLMTISGVAILMALPVSVSRLLVLSVALVAVGGIVAMLLGGRLSLALFFQVTFGAIAIPLILSTLQPFKDGTEAFLARWTQSTAEDQGGVQGAIVERVLKDMFGSFDEVAYSGMGTGFSTNVGQVLLRQEASFGTSEAEWGRLLFDNGYILGLPMVAYRIALAGLLVLVSFKAFRRGQIQGFVFLCACLLIVLQGQWGQASVLGVATIGAGLTLAASTKENTDGEIVD